MSADNQLRSLTKNEVTVLYYKCRGLKYNQIATRLTYSVDWVQLQMSSVYAKLGFNKEMHWTKRREILENEVCPRLPKDLKDWKFEEPKAEITEESIVETKEELKADPQMIALVLYDEMAIQEESKEKTSNITKVESPVIIIPNRDGPNPFVLFLRRVILLIIVVGVLGSVGYIAYWFGKNSVNAPIAITQVITQVLPQPTNPPVLVATTVAPTTTLIPTPLSTDTPAPSATAAFVPPADGILFQDNFSNGISPDWTNSDNWITANGRLTLQAAASFNNIYNWIGLDKPEWKNYTVSVNVKIPFQDSAAQSEEAIAVRTGGAQPKYIGILIDTFSNVYWAIFGSTDSDVIPVSGQNRDSRFTSGSTLQIEVKDNNYTVKVNGQQIQTISLQGYNSGGISLGVDCFSGQECASFSNLKITYIP